MATLYKYEGGWISSACDNCGNYHMMMACGTDGSQNPPTPVHQCNYGTGGGGVPVIVADTYSTTDPTSIAAIATAIQTGVGIVRD